MSRQQYIIANSSDDPTPDILKLLRILDPILFENESVQLLIIMASRIHINNEQHAHTQQTQTAA